MEIEFAQSESIWQQICLAGLGLIALIALVAVISPTWFRRLESLLGHTIDTSRIQELLERPIDTDRYLRRYTRLIGAGALSVAVLFASYLI